MSVDWAEKATKEYLEGLNSGPVLEFPNGSNKPPDFSLGDKIGIEVTRLVQSIEDGAKIVNLTQESPKFQRAFEKVVEKIESAQFNGSYFVHVNYRLPSTRKDTNKTKLLNDCLVGLSKGLSAPPSRITLDKDISIRFYASQENADRPYLWGGANYTQSGGIVLDQLERQCRHAIKRKEKSISKISGNYSEWWLAVSSELTLGVSDDNMRALSRNLDSSEIFTALLLIDFLNPDHSKKIELHRAQKPA